MRGELKNSFAALESKNRLVERMEGDIARLQTPTNESFETLLGAKAYPGTKGYGQEPKDGIVGILTSQRDRYKQRFEQLEAVFWVKIGIQGGAGEYGFGRTEGDAAFSGQFEAVREAQVYGVQG
jgi:CASP C terminal